MDRMKEYVTSVRINLWIIETLLNNIACDRLGTFITFNLVKHPNESISSFRVIDWFKHVIVLLGYTHEHIRSIDSGEMAECWVYEGDKWETVRVGHKYWSLKQCQLCIDLIKSLCVFHDIPIEYYRQEK
jgi:hypothetical protein